MNKALNPSAEGQGLMRNAIGVPGLVFFVISAAGPLMSLMGTLPFSIGYGNGIGVPGVYILGLLLWMLFAVGYSVMSRYVRNTGAFYAYVSQGLGRSLGIGTSVVAIVSYLTILLAFYGLIGSAAASLLAEFGIQLPWWVCTLATCLLVSLFGFRRIDIGARLLGILMLLEVAILLILGAVSLAHAPEGYSFASYTPSSIFSGTPGIAIMYSLGAFIGFEATVIYGEEAKDRKRTVPIATYLAVLILGVLYSFISYSVITGWGSSAVLNEVNSLFAQNLDPAGLFTQLADNQLGAWSVLTIKILFVTSAFAGLSAFHNVITRYMYALGRSGLLPRSFGRVHTVHRSPYVASFVVSILSAVVILLTAAAGWNPVTQLFAWFSAMGTLGLLFLYTLTAVSIVLFFARTGVDKRIWHTRIAPIASAAGLAGATLITVYNFDAMVGTSGSPVPLIMELVLLALFIAGAGLGLWIRKNKPAAFELIGQSVDEPEETEEAYPASRETAAYG